MQCSTNAPRGEAVAAVVGAGPAGVLAAVALARSGAFGEVHVYERHPSPLVANASDPFKAFAILLQPRGRRALEAAGFDVEAFAAGAGDSAPDAAKLHWVDSMVFGNGTSLEAGHLPFERQRLLGSRHAHCRAIVGQAAAMGLPIHFHWETSFESVDLAAKTAVFCSERGHGCSGDAPGSPGGGRCKGVIRQKYDLLVAADGAYSRVRRAAEQQVPGLTCTVEPSSARYKVFERLPPSPSANASQLRMLPCARPASHPHAGVMFLVTSPESGETHGIVSVDAPAWDNLTTVADCQEFLAAQFPALPVTWLPVIAEQLVVNPQAVTGTQVHASQLHGPSLLLVGDAGHGVTPRTGNGLNAGLEDALVLAQLLERSGNDIASLPEQFTAERLEDAHALLWLDDVTVQRRGVGPGGKLAPEALLGGASMVGRTMLNRMTGGLVHPPSLVRMNGGDSVRFSEVKEQIQRDKVILTTIAAPFTAAVSLMTAASVFAGRWRRPSTVTHVAPDQSCCS